MQKTDERVLTSAELMAACGCTRSQLNYLRERHGLQPTGHFGRSVVWSADHIEIVKALLKGRTFKGKGESDGRD